MKLDEIDELINKYSGPYKYKRLMIDQFDIPLTIKQYRSFLHYMAQSKKNNLKLLEIGSYVGLFVDFIGKNYKDIDIYGIDNCRAFVELAKLENLNVQFCNILDIDLLFEKNSFDAAVAQNFFHKEIKFISKQKYYEWIDNISSQIFFVIKKGGFFFFDTEIFIDLGVFIDKGFKIDFQSKSKDSAKYFYSLLKISE